MSNLHLEDLPGLLDKHGPVFILGCPRSGTTFLSSCLSKLDGLEVFDGVLIPPRLIHVIGNLTEEGAPVAFLLKSIRDIYWQAFWRRRYFRSERVGELYQRNLSLVDFLRAPTLEGALFCHKEAFLCFALPALAKEFPQAKFVHIFRDGRDNADSLERCYPDALSDEILKDSKAADNKSSEIGRYRVVDSFCIPWWVTEGQEQDFIQINAYGRYLWMWRDMTERAMALHALVGKMRYSEVRYEDLVADPIAIGGGVARFLGKELNRPARRNLKRAFTSSVKVGSRNAERQRLQQAQAIAGSLLGRLGYE
jgi:hypothetical protein